MSDHASARVASDTCDTCISPIECVSDEYCRHWGIGIVKAPGPVEMLGPEPNPIFPRLAFLSGFCFGTVAGLLFAAYVLGWEPPAVRAEPRPTVMTLGVSHAR